MSTFTDLNQNQIPKNQSFFQKIKVFWLKYGEKSILIVGIVLIALVSFEAGFLKGRQDQKAPVELYQTACAPCPKISELANDNELKDNPATNGAKTEFAKENNDSTAPAENQKCAFIASKNSNKYHLPTCQFASKIKSENMVCFSSSEEAQNRGYQAAKCCIK